MALNKVKRPASKLNAAIRTTGVKLKTHTPKVSSLKDDRLLVKKKKRPIEDVPLKKKRVVEEVPLKKKRVIEEEDEVTERSLIVKRETPLTEKEERKVTRKLAASFGDNSARILEALEAKDADGAHTLIYQSLLLTLVDILPVVENTVRKSKGRYGVYPFNQLVSQLRECLADVQATRDKGQMGAHIVDKFVRPSMLNTAAQVAVAFMNLEGEAKSRMSSTEFAEYRGTISKFRHGIAEYMRQQIDQVTEQVSQSFS